MSDFDFLMLFIVFVVPLMLSVGAGASAREVVRMLNLEGGPTGDLRYADLWRLVLCAASNFLVLYALVCLAERFLGDATHAVWIGSLAVVLLTLPLILHQLTGAPPKQLLAASAAMVAFQVAGLAPVVIFLSLLGSAMAGATGIGWR